MELTIRPKNFKLSERIEAQIRKRVERLPRHLDNLQSAEVILSQQPTRLSPQHFQYVAQFTLHTRNNLIRSEVSDPELLTAVDQAMDRLSRQIERYKGRYSQRKGKPGVGKSSADIANRAVLSEESSAVGAAAPAEAAMGGSVNGSVTAMAGEGEEYGAIVRVKRFPVSPMFPEEAIEQMELLGHSFFVFFNAADERMSVVYRRNDGGYGLLEPELS